MGEIGKACQVPIPLASEVGGGINCSSASAPFAVSMGTLYPGNQFGDVPGGISGLPLPGFVIGQFGKLAAVVVSNGVFAGGQTSLKSPPRSSVVGTRVAFVAAGVRSRRHSCDQKKNVLSRFLL